jgi:hypothetical protein
VQWIWNIGLRLESDDLCNRKPGKMMFTGPEILLKLTNRRNALVVAPNH